MYLFQLHIRRPGNALQHGPGPDGGSVYHSGLRRPFVVCPLHTPRRHWRQHYDDVYILGNLCLTVLKICGILFPSGCVTYVNGHNSPLGKAWGNHYSIQWLQCSRSFYLGSRPPHQSVGSGSEKRAKFRNWAMEHVFC